VVDRPVPAVGKEVPGATEATAQVVGLLAQSGVAVCDRPGTGRGR
jgi:hypothetical protein